jgi:hypothetical protein
VRSTRQHVVVEEIEVPFVEDQKGTNELYERRNLKLRKKQRPGNKNLKRSLEIAKRRQKRKEAAASALGEFHDQAYTKWIVIRGLLRGHNDTLLVTWGLATLRANLEYLITINQ